MKKVICFFVICLIICDFVNSGFASDDSGTFRGKWWNYYDRGVIASDSSDFDNAIKDLKKSLSLRSRDQRMARTYGMHFIDYFPHRELGIIYLNQGRVDEAVKELEESIRSEESAKAVHYLNKARKSLLEKQGNIAPPSIAIEAPIPAALTKGLTVLVKGKVSGKGLVSQVSVNTIPYRFEMAKEHIDFEKELTVEDGENLIRITAVDLLGNKTEKTVTVIVDREGPAVNISDVRNEEKDGMKYIRITGEVTDSTGIERVIVKAGDSIQEPESRIQNKTHSFDISLERKSAQKVNILCYDTLGNETSAEFDTEKEMTAFKGTQRYVLLAFNGGKFFSFDKEQPVLDLKDAGDPPEVFVDKYFIDGQAYDNNKVSKILVNGKEISAGRGKKVYFSKMIKLNEGKNRIVVDVYDSSGNKASAAFTVKRAVPSVMQTASRMSLSVLPIDGRQAGPDITRLAYDRLIDAFVEQKRFSVIERAKLEQILMEHKLAKEKLTDPEHSIKVGKLMSADSILSTSIREDKKSIEIISRIINTETSEIMEVKDVFAEDKSLLSVKELIEGLASKIARSFPVVEGMIIKNDKKEAYSDIGISAKIKKDTGVIIYRKGKEIKHPVTGKSLGYDTVKLGEGHIEEIHEGFSKVRLSNKFKGHEINVKDLVITK